MEGWVKGFCTSRNHVVEAQRRRCAYLISDQECLMLVFTYCFKIERNFIKDLSLPSTSCYNVTAINNGA